MQTYGKQITSVAFVLEISRKKVESGVKTVNRQGENKAVPILDLS